VYIPKSDGRKRPLGITVIEDKIVQRATVTVLNAIYEADFIGFSYGFRPGRHQHKALDALYLGITKKRVNWVLDADIRDFFNSISKEWLIKFVEHRIADKRVIRLVQKWLKAGVLEDGEIKFTEDGTPQGGSASPLMGNIYLHYAFDLWLQQWRKMQASGDVIAVRYADDTVVGFQYKADAEQFLHDLKERFQKFNLELHPNKTRLIEFGRYAARRRESRGEGKPETFDFLGFTHVCGATRNGKFALHRHTVRKRLHAKVKEVAIELRRRMHNPVFETARWLKQVIQGFNQYHAVPSNSAALGDFRYRVYWHWKRVLNRRSQKAKYTWEKINKLIDTWLPKPRILHPYPERRFTGILR
jgi:group II intron reverse transcriptase/maturase